MSEDQESSTLPQEPQTLVVGTPEQAWVTISPDGQLAVHPHLIDQLADMVANRLAERMMTNVRWVQPDA